MVIESEIKQKKIERRGGVRPNQTGRKRNFPNKSITRKQIVLPDDLWEKLHKMYPDSSAAMIIYRLIDDNKNMLFD